MKISEKNRERKTSTCTKAKTKEKGSPAPYAIHLRTAEDVRRLLSSTINAVRKHELDASIARTVIYGASVLLTVLQQTSFVNYHCKLVRYFHEN